MDNYRLTQIASQSSVAVALILTCAKIYAVYTTQSLSILTSLFDSSIDMVASIGNLIAITVANKPASSKFQFGYGKLEAVSALIQSILIIVSLLFLIAEAAQRFFQNDANVIHAQVGINVMIISIFLTIGLMIFQNYVIKRTKSIAIKADSLHYKTDLAVNSVVIISLLLSPYYAHIDSFASLCISLYVILSTRHIIKESLSVLLDQEIESKEKQQIIDILNNHPKVLGFHNFRTRTSGKRIFIEAHIEMDPKLSLIEAHHIAHELKDSVEAIYPHAEMIVHQDPAGHDTSSEKRF